MVITINDFLTIFIFRRYSDNLLFGGLGECARFRFGRLECRLVAVRRVLPRFYFNLGFGWDRISVGQAEVRF